MEEVPKLSRTRSKQQVIHHSPKNDRGFQSSAVQIVKINEEGTKFELDEAAVDRVFNSVPENTKVALISIVGAFRTGKSFVLDLFLRYLRYINTIEDSVLRNELKFDRTSTDWVAMGIDGEIEKHLEGNSNGVANDKTGASEPTATASALPISTPNSPKSKGAGFSWRAGKERNTTGIWIWGEPFYLKTKKNEKIAVFLLDTQGMFDSNTTQMLTASIFGLSTLLSSHQIYNVDKRIQEDNLQHLALFSEYGRMALANHVEEDVVTDVTDLDEALNTDCSVKEVIPSEKNKDGCPPATTKPKLFIDLPVSSKSTNEITSPCSPQSPTGSRRPFQLLEFLVRDWQNFEEDETVEVKIKEMENYMQSIFVNRVQSDLASTREQISSCFQSVSCWLLPHPGLEVVKRSYDGSVEKISGEFLELLSFYAYRIFVQDLQPKLIHGRAVTASELLVYIKTYVSLFKEAQIFPEAKTLLDATAEANNVNTRDKAISEYKNEMDKLLGSSESNVKGVHLPPTEIEKHHLFSLDKAVKIFKKMANMGRRSQIEQFQQQLLLDIESEYGRYKALNAERDPYKNVDIYLICGSIALILFLTKQTQDVFCYDTVGFDIPFYDCKHVGATLSHLYLTLFFLMIIIFFATGQRMFQRIRMIFKVFKQAIVLASKPDYKQD